jgi:hypothetical protein
VAIIAELHGTVGDPVEIVAPLLDVARISIGHPFPVRDRPAVRYLLPESAPLVVAVDATFDRRWGYTGGRQPSV